VIAVDDFAPGELSPAHAAIRSAAQ
jgi:hypothetical protein